MRPCERVQSTPACNNLAWQAASLKLLHERPFASLFLESIDQTVFDPTGLEHVNNIYYVVFNRQGSLCASLPRHVHVMQDNGKLCGL